MKTSSAPEVVELVYVQFAIAAVNRLEGPSAGSSYLINYVEKCLCPSCHNVNLFKFIFKPVAADVSEILFGVINAILLHISRRR